MYRRSASAALLTGLLGACQSATAPTSAAAVSVQLARTTVPAGAAVPTTVTVQNRGDAPLRLVGGSTCMAYLDVRTAAGERVGGDSRVCTADLRERAVAPGDAWTDYPAWNGRVRGGAAAPLGVYVIRGGVSLAGSRQVWSAPVSITVVTP
jgi:hypothetical protein